MFGIPYVVLTIKSLISRGPVMHRRTIVDSPNGDGAAGFESERRCLSRATIERSCLGWDWKGPTARLRGLAARLDSFARAAHSLACGACVVRRRRAVGGFRDGYGSSFSENY
ncbi:hypothetical protein BRD01_06865 [Halobacteriales archaeon QS_8_65_32]|nr:MAG: hypothetical protein BRD01_06865 [Halobacteriales archaeon QS_8_65_32]